MIFWKRHGIQLPTIIAEPHFIEFVASKASFDGSPPVKIFQFETEDEVLQDFLLAYRGPNGEKYEHKTENTVPEVNLEDMTKAELIEYAENGFGLDLDMRLKRAEMIAAIQGRAGLEE